MDTQSSSLFPLTFPSPFPSPFFLPPTRAHGCFACPPFGAISYYTSSREKDWTRRGERGDRGDGSQWVVYYKYKRGNPPFVCPSVYQGDLLKGQLFFACLIFSAVSVCREVSDASSLSRTLFTRQEVVNGSAHTCPVRTARANLSSSPPPSEIKETHFGQSASCFLFSFASSS